MKDLQHIRNRALFIAAGEVSLPLAKITLRKLLRKDGIKPTTDDMWAVEMRWRNREDVE